MSGETNQLKKDEVITSFDFSTILNFIAQKEQLGYKVDIGKSSVFFGTVTVHMTLEQEVTDVETEPKSKDYTPTPAPTEAKESTPASAKDSGEGGKEVVKQKTKAQLAAEKKAAEKAEAAKSN